MDEYYEYLAVHVLNEKETVTYRTLSRALKVHVNLAKQMLWDFHNKQNTKKPGSVHATYLLCGSRRAKPSTALKRTQVKDEDDTIMGSSPPFPSSSMPQQDESQASEAPSQRSLLLVKEEHLEKAKSTFVELTGIHVYSLQPQRLGDFRTLTECSRKIYAMLRTEDPLEMGKHYGTIQNANVTRRSVKAPPPPATASKKPIPAPATAKPKPDDPKDKAENQKPATGKAAPKPSMKEDQKPASSKTAGKPATLKRGGSDIMSSFAKNAGKPKAKPTEAQSKKEEPEDTMMAGMSDDDPDDDDAQEIDIESKAPSGKSKQDREAELKAMMEVEDDDMDVEPEPQVDEPAPVPEVEPEKETVIVEGGRRRGRRKVTKKRTVRDEEGYLVTKEEAVWESFSEDEPAPKKSKTSQAPTSTAKKAGNKPGQGNIMSFFGRK